MNQSDAISFTKYTSMEDWKKFRYTIDHESLTQELAQYPRSTWPRYNPRKPIERYCLDLTQTPYGNDNVSSLKEYNAATGNNFRNQDFTKLTEVYEKLPTVQKLLDPFKPWLGRSHIIRIDAGGYFPPHYDTVVVDDEVYDVRMIACINNIDKNSFKWLHEDKAVPLETGQVWLANTGKPHSVFSFTDDAIIMVANLRFDKHLFAEFLNNHYEYT
jgi:hypothetical protein